MDKIQSVLKKILHILWAISKQFLIILLYLILVVSLQIYLKKDIMSTNIWLSNISGIFAELVLLLIFIFIFRKTLIPDYYDFKKNGKNYIKNSGIYWVIGLAIMIISNLIISNFIGVSSNEAANQNLLVQMPIYSSIVMIIIAPITEELLTRVILKDAFKKPFFFIFLSGLIFGSLHLFSATTFEEIFYIIPYGALGGSFALMYYKTQNIWTNISFHALHNAIALLLFFIGV